MAGALSPLPKEWVARAPAFQWRDVLRETRTGGPRLAVVGPLPSPHRAV
ncbi:hypothetical protein ACH4OX_32630 [Streptomyces roseolus]